MVTIKDISKITGFSVTTVSRALNNFDDVKEETKNVIQKTADELGYSPNILARSLVMKQSKTLGLIVSGLKLESTIDNFMFQTLCGVSDFLSSSSYDFVLLSTNTTKQKNKNFRQICTERQLDGVIIQGLKIDDPYLQEALSSDLPCVLIDVPTGKENIGTVTSNQFESAKDAVTYLQKIGHKNIAYMNGSENAYVSKIRKKGYQAALKEFNNNLNTDYIVSGDFSEEKSREVALGLLQKHPEITAIFCASDVMALGVLKAARELKIKVPDRLSIIGFDNILVSAYVTPALSTVGQFPYKMGLSAAEILVGMVEGTGKAKTVEITNELIVRDSVAVLG